MNNKNSSRLHSFFLAACLALVLNGCSDDEPKQQAKKVHNPWDHTHDSVVTDVQKHVFEHDFAEQCVERETKNSINKDNDRKRFTKPCMCIATFMMKDLTAVEAEKFLKENKSTQSLRIRFENAAYHCLQNKEQPKSPQLFKR
ncbi:MAG: hypothetical protein KAJ63_01285 [Methyloprofundus sp.]|nr:hypothetical protein [Methyloprofundus sp.]